MAGARPFVNAAAAGLSVDAARAASRHKSRLGPLAYTFGAVRAGDQRDAAALRAGVRRRAALRGPRVAGHRRRHRRVRRRQRDRRHARGDGLLDVAVVPAGSRVGLVRRALGMRAGRLTEQDDVGHERGAVIELEIGGSPTFNVDGETCRCDPARFTLHEGGFDARDAAMNKRWPAAIALVLGARYASDSLRHRREQGGGYELRGEEIEVGSDAFLRATEAITAAPIAHGNDIELLINGDEIFPAMIETMASAQRSVNFLTYIYWSGEIAREIAAALCERAKAGVEVNVLLDAVGSAKMDRGLIRDMEDAGVTFAYFRPPKLYAIRRLNNRTHRKLLVVDGKVGMTGGVGIADQWTGNAQDPDHWRDTHVRVRGPIVRGLQGAFAEDWLEATGDVLVGPAYLPELEPRRRRRRDAGRALEGDRRRHERRGAVLPGDRLRADEPAPDVGVLRAAPGVRRGADRGGASAASTCACWSPVRTSTRSSSARRGAPSTRSCSTAGCGSTSTARR